MDNGYGVAAPRLWNDDLPADVISLSVFKKRLKTHLFRQSLAAGYPKGSAAAIVSTRERGANFFRFLPLAAKLLTGPKNRWDSEMMARTSSTTCNHWY